MRRFLISIDIVFRTADRAIALARFDEFLREHGLAGGRTRQSSGYVKDDVNSRVFGTAAIEAADFATVIARLRRLDAAIFGGSPVQPSRFFKVLMGDPAGVEIVGPSPDAPIDDPQIAWINIEAEDSAAWNDRLVPLHDQDQSSDREIHFRLPED